MTDLGLVYSLTIASTYRKIYRSMKRVAKMTMPTLTSLILPLHRWMITHEITPSSMPSEMEHVSGMNAKQMKHGIALA